MNLLALPVPSGSEFVAVPSFDMADSLSHSGAAGVMQQLLSSYE